MTKKQQIYIATILKNNCKKSIVVYCCLHTITLRIIFNFPQTPPLLSHSSWCSLPPPVPDELSITLCGFIRSLSKLPALSVMLAAEGLFWRPPLCN